MKRDITNIIAARFLLAISLKRRVSALFVRLHSALSASFAAAGRGVVARKGAAEKPRRIASGAGSFSVNFQPG